MKIGIIGNGYVGKATSLLECEGVESLIYDKDPEKCSPQAKSLHDLFHSDFIFLCVPTPMISRTGECHTGIVESVVKELKGMGYPSERIVIRSTVPVGTSANLGVCFMPEFLTEANWKEDFKNVSNRIIGIPNPKDQALSAEFLNLFYKAETSKKIGPSVYSFCSTKEAETVKLARNSFLAVKVSFFNEIHSFCKKSDIDYEAVATMIATDERIGASHIQVPGPDGKKGFGGTCFPKDINSFIYQMNQKQLIASIMGAAKYRNENLDRPEQDWTEDKGRAVI